QRRRARAAPRHAARSRYDRRRPPMYSPPPARAAKVQSVRFPIPSPPLCLLPPFDDDRHRLAQRQRARLFHPSHMVQRIECLDENDALVGTKGTVFNTSTDSQGTLWFLQLKEYRGSVARLTSSPPIPGFHSPPLIIDRTSVMIFFGVSVCGATSPPPAFSAENSNRVRFDLRKCTIPRMNSSLFSHP